MTASTFLFETLESRMLLSATLVRLTTTLGNIDVRLTDDVTPITVTNFLNYVNSGRYTNSLIHRNSGAVIQGGGYTAPNYAAVSADAAIVNEFQAGVTTNIRGTIGMAKTSDPNSATSEFFFNLTDNSSSFDNPLNSGGFTTFGTVTADTLATMDAIAAVPVTHNFSSPFDELPLINYSGTGGPALSSLVLVKTATVLGVFDNTVTFGDGAAKQVVFTDADGTVTTLKLNHGVGTIHFGGSDVFESTKNGKITVTGTNVTLDSISITGAANANLSINANGGNGSVDLGDLTAVGTVANVNAKTTSLTGTLTVNGDVAKITLGSIITGAIVDSGTALPTKIKVNGVIADSTITSAGTIQQLNAVAWTDSNSSSSSLTAMALTKLAVTGEMAADLTLSGSGIVLGNAKLGVVSGGTWSVNDSAMQIKAVSTGAGWTGVFGGNVNKFSAISMSGNFTAASAGTIKATTINGANINLNKTFDGAAALGKLNAQSIINSNVRSTDLISAIKAQSVDGSIFSAGINFSDNSIDDITDFVNPATITKFKSSTFNNSAVIAANLGNVALGITNDAPPALDFFGVAANTITQLTMTVINQKLNLKLIDDPAAVPGLIAAQGVTLNNIQVKVV